MKVSLIENLLALSAILLMVNGQNPDFSSFIDSMLGGDQLNFFADNMGSVMNSVGGSIENSNRPDFGQGMQDMLSLMDNVSIDMMTESGNFPHDFEQHMQAAVGALGPMSCLLGGPDLDQESMGLVMGGVSGALVGESLGNSASSSNYDFREPFAEMGAIAGVLGSAGAAFIPENGEFDPEKFREILPNPDMIENIWSELSHTVSGDNKKFPLSDTSKEKLESFMKESANSLSGLIEDYGSIASTTYDKLLQGYEIPGSTMRRIAGMHYVVNKRAVAAGSAAALSAGALEAMSRRAFSESNTETLSKSAFQQKIKMLITKAFTIIRILLDSMANLRKELEVGQRTLSGYSAKRLRLLSANLGMPVGLLARNVATKIGSRAVTASLMPPLNLKVRNMKTIDGGEMRKTARALTRNMQGRMNYQETLKNKKIQSDIEHCMGGVMPILEEIEHLSMLMVPEMKILDWQPPFETAAKDSWSKRGLPRFVVGDDWSGVWSFDDLMTEFDLPERLQAVDFANSFVPGVLEDPEIVDFINYANTAGKTSLIDFLKGRVNAASLPVGALREIPISALEFLPNKNELSLDNFIDVLRRGRPDFMRFAKFMGNISDTKLMNIFERASGDFWSGRLTVDPKMAALMNKELSHRIATTEFSSLLNDFTPGAITRMSCVFGILDYFLHDFGSLFKSVIPEITECLEFDLKRFGDKATVKRLQRALSETFTNEFSLEEAVKLRYLINALPATLIMSMDAEKALALAVNVTHMLLPFVPQFKPLAHAFGYAATSAYANINDTSVIESLGIITCGLRDVLFGSGQLQVSSEVEGIIRATCSRGLRQAKAIELDLVRKCMRNKKCSFQEEKPVMYQEKPQRILGDDIEPILEQSASQIFLHFHNESEDRLSRDEKRLVLKKLIQSHLLNFTDSWEAVGDVTSELPADSMIMQNAANLTRFVARNPGIVQKMSDFSKTAIVSKLSSNMDEFIQELGRLKSLIAKIPNSLLSDLDYSSNKNLSDAVAMVNWMRTQALRLTSSSRSLTLHDIRKMGTLAIGLTCHDVRKMKLNLMPQIANLLDEQIGRQISPDLAECVSVKLYLYIRNKFKDNQQRMLRFVASKVPPVFASFFPTQFLQSLPSCAGFFKQISTQVDDLFPSLSGGFVLEELAGAAFNCFAYSTGMEIDMDDEFPTIPRLSPSHNPMTHNMIPDGLGPDFSKFDFMDSSGEFHPEYAYMNHTYDGRPQFGEEDAQHFFSSQMSHITPDKFKLMGGLICKIRAEQIRYAPKQELRAILPAMHRCINKITKATVDAIHAKIENEFGMPQSWSEDILRTLGPFVATLSSSKIEDIPNNAFSSVFEHLRPPPKERQDLTGDKSTSRLDVKNLFLFSIKDVMGDMMGSSLPVFDESYSPVKRAEFYGTAVKKLMQGPVTVSAIRRFGQDILPFLPFDRISPAVLVESLGIFSDNEMDLSESQENTIKSKINQYLSDEGISKLSDEMVQRLGKLSLIFSSTEMREKLHIFSLQTLATLGKTKWKDADQVSAVLEIYLNGRGYASLTGLELIAMGNMHCFLDAFKVDELTATSFKFALRHIGKLRCFAQEQIDLYKGKVESAFGSIDAATLQEMGILAAGFSSAELQSFGKPERNGQISPLAKDVNLISPRALKVMPSSRIIAGFDESQLALMGTTNGGTLLQREDVLHSVSNSTKNAIFASAFGLNAGVYAGAIRHFRNFNETALKEMREQMESMMEKLQHAMTAGLDGGGVKRKPNPSKTKPSQAFGLKDVLEAKRPTPPPLAIGLSKNDLTDNFEQKYLNDRVIVELINNAASNDLKVIEVLKGESTINDIPDEDIKKVPPKILQGLKKNTIQQMSPKKLALLLDSDEVSRDPKSLSKVLKKLTINQFKNALEILSEKMMNGTSTIWRPPISIQEAVAKAFFGMNHGSTENALRSYLSCMCPFSAGVPPRRILDLPQDETYIIPMIKCIDMSYKDLSRSHKKQMLNWVNTMWRKDQVHADKAVALRSFLLDFPLGQLERSFTISDVTTYVNSGMLSKLDTTHKKFTQLAKFLVKATLKLDATKFRDEAFMENLGRAKCEIRVKHVKSHLDTTALRSLLNYTMKHCKDHVTELKESLEECIGDAALRLQRCKLLAREIKKVQKKAETSGSVLRKVPKKAELKRASIRDYEMMKDVVNVYLKDKDLTQLAADDVREVAGAIGALKPKEIEKIPENAILDNIDVLKNNTKLTKKQKRKIFEKIQSAGFELSDSSSVLQLGELVTSVRPREFRKLSVTGLKESLSELKKHSNSLSPAQKKAIVSKLNEGSVAEIVNADLGNLVTEIPLSELNTLETIEMDKLKDKPWSRGQAANIVRKFREKNGLNDFSLTVGDIREMGRASVGISCMDIMNILNDEAYDATQALVEETERSLTLDMDDCLSTKVHYSLQVLNGIDYLSNSSDPDLPTLLGFIPEDVAMMMPPDGLEVVPATSCLGIMENIGSAQLDLLPEGTGDLKRVKLANISFDCIKDNTLVEGDLDESQAIVMGRLVCDLTIAQWQEFSSEAFTSILPVLRECFHQLDTERLEYLKMFINSAYGADSSLWGEEELTTLGSLVTILDKSSIDDIDQVLFYESIDDMMPPELPTDTDAYAQVHYDAFYNKLVAVVMAQRLEESLRRKRQISALTYDEIVVLGPGNVALSVEELNAINEEDFVNSLESLGAVSKWSYDQRTALVDRLKQIYGSPSTWSSKVLSDAKYLIKGLSYTDLSQLQIDDIETCTTLSEVEFTNEERVQIINAYLRANGLDLRLLTSSELAGFGSLACGLDPTSFIEIPVDTIQGSLKDLGALDCFSQTQMDIVKQISLIGKGRSIPTSAELHEMGTIAAGLSSGDLRSLPVESIAYIKPEAILLISTSRLKAGLNETQLLAAGVQNIAALMTPSIFQELLAEQRNALRLAAYGDDAELEDIPITEAPFEEEYDSGEFAVFGDDSEEDHLVVSEPTSATEQETTTAGTSASNSSIFVSFLSCLVCFSVVFF